jgi:hypothetical protein
MAFPIEALHMRYSGGDLQLVERTWTGRLPAFPTSSGSDRHIDLPEGRPRGFGVNVESLAQVGKGATIAVKPSRFSELVRWDAISRSVDTCSFEVGDDRLLGYLEASR